MCSFSFLCKAVCVKYFLDSQRKAKSEISQPKFWLCFTVLPTKVMRLKLFCCTIFTSQHSSFDLLLSAYLDRPQAVRQPCKGVMSCDVPPKVGFCTWAWWSWMELNTCKQMLLFFGTKLLACSGLALIHSLLLFPLHRFLSLFMSKFN